MVKIYFIRCLGLSFPGLAVLWRTALPHTIRGMCAMFCYFHFAKLAIIAK